MSRADVAFTPAVKAVQERMGSRAAYAARIARRDFGGAISEDLAAWIAERDSFYLATASAEGQPYIQHRGGEPGFLVVVDAHTLAFADYAGNRQYISVGNLSENDRVSLFLMDYPNRQRVKVWGTATVADPDDERVSRVVAASPGQRIERVIVVAVGAWDSNCPQHITPRFTQRELERWDTT